ncbi:MAG: HAMP domain-containing histidine kinase, partial [Gemmatimonadetes bacterium]|nr:HAMP domain-containing histidine kinase [Gemmatimonadota bacterium]
MARPTMTEPMPMTIADAQPISFEEMVRRNDGLSDRLRDAEDLIYRLKKSQNLLNQSGRLSSVGQLAAMVVHEIRGPLTGISGQAELLLMQELTDKQRRSLDLILTAAWRLNDLTEDIMLFSLGPDERAPVADLGHVVERVVSQLRPLASSRVGIQLQLLPAGLDVDGCGWLLAQVMTNLLLNALDA